jgi:demethylmenaquinone methyltransferase/2-methoxy-6-polyprenyl-1,4-benzoquinol methylase
LPGRSVAGVVSGFALRNFADLAMAFGEMARVLRPGGRLSLLDVAQPDRTVLRIGHSVYFGHVVPKIGAVLSDGAAYRYLPRSVAYLPPPAGLIGQLEAAGFTRVERRLLSAGITQLYTATRKDD